MPFGEFTLLKVTDDEKECTHSDTKLSYIWQRKMCTACGLDYYIVKCLECGQQFTKCRHGGCNNGKMVMVT